MNATAARGPAGPVAVTLPGGGRVHARGLSRARPPEPPPQFGLYLLGHPLDRPGVYGRYLVGLAPWSPPWPFVRIDWPDFAAPRRPAEAVAELRRTLGRIECGERVEIACGGGRGRTGAALAVLAVLRGLTAAEALRWVRSVYDARAVESRRQRRWVEGVAAGAWPAVSGP
ncbi:MAG TPA: phosphatase [Pseudonocardia sp.]|nr:phosphatase [Pseudonocardia sp.]